ncbi:hypothetical protein SKTS_08350 [Sulfurimicrobium lacus]|uniref:Antitoxin n=1 Tax=Sulfurimicrobium lacus TaxID=2715678 RepID=A0A6F8VB21_9PROT|nr:type II toxin-antitoxin system Phd/YefM family antitoxin [Sulfurimicrobium lacus]BCB25949.1 hypothetical protein SKTS_08350 [Sulfurimicrobium lacus]
MHSWQIQEAKARISEVVKCAQNQGPQEITLHGKPVAVLVSCETYDRLAHRSDSLLEFMHRSPLYGLEEIEFVRDQSLTREVEL